jgi:hypothetical protein
MTIAASTRVAAEHAGPLMHLLNATGEFLTIMAVVVLLSRRTGATT